MSPRKKKKEITRRKERTTKHEQELPNDKATNDKIRTFPDQNRPTPTHPDKGL